MHFHPLFRTGLALLSMTALAGCASNGPGYCAAIGAGIGAVGGGVGGGLYSANNTDRDHNALEGAGIAAASTLVGAGLGYLVCSMMEEEEEPRPAPRAQPAPTPPPRPAPAPPPAPTRPDPCTQTVTLEGVRFDNDSAKLGPNAPMILDETVEALQKCPNRQVRLNAYTDSNGSDAYNEKLSQRRAESVREYLVSHGVSASRIEARGLGESNPIADNSTAEGRAKNRRVEIEPID